MKFCIALVEGKRTLCNTQADAKKLDPHYTQIDIPVHSAGLQDFVQALFDQIDATPAEAPPPAPPPEVKECYSDFSTRVEAEFLALPPYHQLSLIHEALDKWQAAYAEVFKESKKLSWL